MQHELTLHGGAFAPLHARLVGVEIDFGALALERFAPELIERARVAWQERVGTEYRSAQMLSRLLLDSLAAGTPFDGHAGVADLIADELRHVALCASLVRALGATPFLPDPVELKQPAAFDAMSAAQRSLSIAVTMLVVNETLSVGYIEDLHARCHEPVVRAVLGATLADEAEHDAFGLEYVRRALALLPEQARASWHDVAARALRPQRERAEGVLRQIPPELRTLEAFDDEREVALGLFSPQRQALVFERTYAERLEPRLRELRLL